MMQKKWMLCLGTFLFLNQVNAAPFYLDVYGVDPDMQKKIIALSKESVKQYILLDERKYAEKQSESSDLKKKKEEIKQSLFKKINKHGAFSLVDMTAIRYPTKKYPYVTIDLVLAKDADRFPSAPQRLTKKNMPKEKGLVQLFKTWTDYYQKNYEIAMKDEFDFDSKSCPFVHCLWGFDKKELKEVAPKLKTGATRYKNQLMDIVRFSENQQDREDAFFILAHTDDYQGLAHFLMHYIDDADQGARNDSMRILGGVLGEHEVAGIDIHRILKALNYPYLTDRNKASYVLYQFVQKNKAVHHLVIQESGDTLIQLLRLEQPNNHDFAYLVLKEISGKKYSEHDYTHWQQWVNSERNKLKNA